MLPKAPTSISIPGETARGSEPHPVGGVGVCPHPAEPRGPIKKCNIGAPPTVPAFSPGCNCEARWTPLPGSLTQTCAYPSCQPCVSLPKPPPRPCQPPRDGATTLQEALEGPQSPVRAAPDARDDHATQPGPNVCRDGRDGVNDGTPGVLGLAEKLPKTPTPPPPGREQRGHPYPATTCVTLPRGVCEQGKAAAGAERESGGAPRPTPFRPPHGSSPVAPGVGDHMWGSEAPPRSTPSCPRSPSTPSLARAARRGCMGVLQPPSAAHPHPGGCGWRGPAGHRCCQ